MLPFGHLGAAYLLSQPDRKLTLKEILLILWAALLPDFDLLVSFLLNVSHHDLITHTPLGIFLIWLFFIWFFRKDLSRRGKVLMIVALFSHLLLDEAGHWFYRLGWQSIYQEAQINWFYPLTAFPLRANEGISFPAFILIYLQQAKANVLAEIVLSLLSLTIAFKRFVKRA